MRHSAATTVPFLIFLVHACATAQLVPIPAAEAVPAATTRAQAALGSDAHLSNVIFAPVTTSGITVSFDMTTGKATGWLYRFTSPSRDSSIFLVAAKVPLLGLQVIDPPAGTAIPLPPLPGVLDFSPPWVDSSEMLAGAKAGAAGAFLQAHPAARVDFILGLNNPVENPLVPAGKYWLIRFTDDIDTLTCAIDAATGQSVRCGSLPTSVRDETPPAVSDLSITPSPLRGNGASALLRFVLDRSEYLTLTVHDALGRETGRITARHFEAGAHAVQVDGAVLGAAGLHFIRVAGSGSTRVLRVAVVR